MASLLFFLLVRSDAICDSARYSTANVLHDNRWPSDLSSRWPKLRSCPSSSECDSCRISGHVLRWSIPAQRGRSSGSTAALCCVSTAATAADRLSNSCGSCSWSTHCCRLSDDQCCLQSQCFVSPTIVGRCWRCCSTTGPTRAALGGHASGTTSSIQKLKKRVLCVAVPSRCCVLPPCGLLPSLLALLLVVYHFGNSRIPVLDCFLYLREFHFRLCHVLVQLLVYMFSCSINIFTLNLYIENTASQLLFTHRSSLVSVDESDLVLDDEPRRTSTRS